MGEVLSGCAVRAVIQQETKAAGMLADEFEKAAADPMLNNKDYRASLLEAAGTLRNTGPISLWEQAAINAIEIAMLATSPATAALGTQEGDRFSDTEKIAAILFAGGHYYHAETVRLLASQARTIEALRAAHEDIAKLPRRDERMGRPSLADAGEISARALKEHPNG